jgi:hypothetical protein
MAKALEEQGRQHNVEGLSFEERLGLLVDRKAVERESSGSYCVSNTPTCGRAQSSRTPTHTHTPRGLDRALFAKLARGEWIARRQDLIITGKTEPAS